MCGRWFRKWSGKNGRWEVEERCEEERCEKDRGGRNVR
jgi:hypothetical protein